VIVFIDGNTPKAYPLTASQSRDLLDFCRAVGAEVFTVNFLFVKGEESERLSYSFYERLSKFRAGEKLLENVYGNGFTRQECWTLNDESVELILTETGGDLFAYNVLYLPEQWLVYVGDAIILQAVSHEQEITLRLSETAYSEFRNLSIPHKQGQPQWSGLPENPIRTTSRP
jgi:hypothetical protein